MTHVINPMLFYWCSVSDFAKAVSILSSIIIGIACLICFGIGAFCIGDWADSECGKDDDEYKVATKLLNWGRKCIVPLVISLILSVFIPSEKTIYKMMVANVVTYENIDLTADTIEEAFDHVIDKLVELGDKEK